MQFFKKKDQQISKITGTRWINPLHRKFSEDLKKQIIWKLLDFVVVLCFNLIYLNLIFPKVVKSYLAYVIDPDIPLPLFLLLTIVIDTFKVWVRDTCSNTSLSGWSLYASVKRPSQGAGGNALLASAAAPKSWKVHSASTDHPAGACQCPELCKHLAWHVLCGASRGKALATFLTPADAFGRRSSNNQTVFMN